jgi:protein N-terminal methyltransferase
MAIHYISGGLGDLRFNRSCFSLNTASHTILFSSKSFLLPLLKLNGGRAGCHRVLDCGAGIGRISKHLFLPVFENIDLVELNQNFLNQAKTEFPTLPDGHKLDRCYCSGLQDFTPGKEEYDVIWCQWVLGHLTDDHLVEFFKRCKTGRTILQSRPPERGWG